MIEMKAIKFIRFWWEYNMKSDEPSGLFTIAFILMIPVIVVWVWLHTTNEVLEDSREKRNTFFNEWKKFKD